VIARANEMTPSPATLDPPKQTEGELSVSSTALPKVGKGTTKSGITAPAKPQSPAHERSKPNDERTAEVVENWEALVAAGRFEEVVERASAQGVETVLASGSAVQVRALAQAARYTGRSGLSESAWLAVRRRFASEAAGRQAAFFLARIHEDTGRLDQALRWLETYLAEAPSGVYAAEASGRRLSLVKRQRGTAAARSAAKSYLERFPRGSYATSAHALLAED